MEILIVYNKVQTADNTEAKDRLDFAKKNTSYMSCTVLIKNSLDE